jgi:hypothetical protein
LTETVRYVARTAAPILYAAGFAPGIVGTIVVVSVIETTIGFDNFTTFHNYGDVATTASAILIGTLVFGLLDRVFVWLEQLRRPTVRDHLRHCVVMYTILLILAVKLIATYESSAAYGISLGYGLAVTAFFIVGYAICVDAAILSLQRRRFDRASLGGAT